MFALWRITQIPHDTQHTQSASGGKFELLQISNAEFGFIASMRLRFFKGYHFYLIVKNLYKILFGINTFSVHYLIFFTIEFINFNRNQGLI
jgi:hypothetical protein